MISTASQLVLLGRMLESGDVIEVLLGTLWQPYSFRFRARLTCRDTVVERLAELDAMLERRSTCRSVSGTCTGVSDGAR